MCMVANSPVQENEGYGELIATTSLELALDDTSLFIMISIGLTDTLSRSLVSSGYAESLIELSTRRSLHLLGHAKAGGLAELYVLCAWHVVERKAVKVVVFERLRVESMQ